LTLHKITHFCTEWLSVCPSITEKFCIITIFQSYVKQNNDSNKTFRYDHDLLLYQTLFVQVQQFVSYLHRTKDFNIQPPSTSIFLVFHKNGFIKGCSSSEDLSAFNIPWSNFDWCNFCIRPRSLNVPHFGTVEGTGLKIMASGYLQRHEALCLISCKSTSWFKRY
jgi:hypothetical protein